ncbi:hypothetical protein HKD37_10G027797 [Glycine soja]
MGPQQPQPQQIHGSKHRGPLGSSHKISTIMCIGINDEHIKLLLFSFFTEGNAADWINSYPHHSLTIWEEVKDKFLNHFFPESRVEAIKERIVNFKQAPIESLFDVWERYKALLRRFPFHGYNQFMQISMFMKGITNDCRRTINSLASVNYLNKTTTQVKTIIEDLVMKIEAKIKAIQQLQAAISKKPKQSRRLTTWEDNNDRFQNIHGNYNLSGDNKPQQRPNLWDHTAKLEEALTKLTEVVIKSMETQIGQLSKQLQTSSIGFFATTEENPKDHYKVIISTVECDMGGEEEEEVEESTAIEEEMKAQSNLSFQVRPTRNLKDKECFTIPITLGNLSINHVLHDLGASCNLMPHSFLEKIGRLNLKPTNMTLQFIDGSKMKVLWKVVNVTIKRRTYKFQSFRKILHKNHSCNRSVFVKESIHLERARKKCSTTFKALRIFPTNWLSNNTIIHQAIDLVLLEDKQAKAGHSGQSFIGLKSAESLEKEIVKIEDKC